MKTQQNKTRFRGLNPKPAETFSPGWSHQPELKVLRPDARLQPTWMGL
jgi:hypothetical protein